ncbi:MAG: Phosphomannomutase, partial [candidate division CPR3 bacterium GW2011_GWE2_35_7]
FASLRLLQYLSRTNQTLSETVAKMPKYVSSPEIKFGCADEIKFDFIKTKITKEFKNLFGKTASYIDIDGIRADTKDEMVIIRASQNGPYLTVKFEGKTQKKYNDLKKKIKAILKKYKEVDFSSGVNKDALD